MTARYLLDTTVILDHVHGHRPASVLLERLFDEGASLFVCDVVVAEAYAFGDDAHRDVVTRLIRVLDYAGADAAVAQDAGRTCAEGGIGLTEAIIVATARSIGATIVTRNRPQLERYDALTY